MKIAGVVATLFFASTANAQGHTGGLSNAGDRFSDLDWLKMKCECCGASPGTNCVTIELELPTKPQQVYINLFGSPPPPPPTIVVSDVTVSIGSTIQDVIDYAVTGMNKQVAFTGSCRADKNVASAMRASDMPPKSYFHSGEVKADWHKEKMILTFPEHEQVDNECHFSSVNTRPITTAKITTTPTTTTTKTTTTTANGDTGNTDFNSNNNNNSNDNDKESDALAENDGTTNGEEAGGGEGDDTDAGGGKTNTGGGGSSAGCCSWFPFTSCNSPSASTFEICNNKEDCEGKCNKGTWLPNGLKNNNNNNGGGTNSTNSTNNPAATAQSNNDGMIAGIVIGVLVLILLAVVTTVLCFNRCCGNQADYTNNTNANYGNNGNNGAQGVNASISSNMITNQAALAPLTAPRGPLNNSTTTTNNTAGHQHSMDGSSTTDGDADDLYYAEPVTQQPVHQDPDLAGYGHAGAASTYEYAPVATAITQAAAGKAAGAAIVYATYASSNGDGDGDGDAGAGDGGGGGSKVDGSKVDGNDDGDEGYEMPAERATSAVVNGVVQPLVHTEAGYSYEMPAERATSEVVNGAVQPIVYQQTIAVTIDVGAGDGNDAGYEMPSERVLSTVVNGIEVPTDFNGC